MGWVSQTWVYPLKSMQGTQVPHIDIAADGVTGDRRWALIDVETNKVLSAKRVARLLDASVDFAGTITLPDGTQVVIGEPDTDTTLSQWLGRPVVVGSADDSAGLAYEMTFDPPNDDAELFDIPVPAGTFVDLAPVHLITTATLRAGAASYPELNFDVRRFRPNLVIDTGDNDPFVEDTWAGATLRVGGAVLAVTQPTVRCAMPLRPQPGLESQPELFDALSNLQDHLPNHLGVYAEVVEPATVRQGDLVELD